MVGSLLGSPGVSSSFPLSLSSLEVNDESDGCSVGEDIAPAELGVFGELTGGTLSVSFHSCPLVLSSVPPVVPCVVLGEALSCSLGVGDTLPLRL